MFSSAHALYCEQYSRWKVKKQRKKWRSCPDQSKVDTYEIWYCTVSCKSPKSMSLKIEEPLFSLLHTIQCRYEITLSSNIMMFVKKLQHMSNAQKIMRHTLDKPINSSYTHKWWTQMNVMMNINILMFILRTQQHSHGQNINSPRFSSKSKWGARHMA